MGNIVILDENTANKIAAGEVVERPASVVKELVENSIDAGAKTITVEIRSGGISYIRVTDDGSGMQEDDVEIAFERHSTSKIRSANDLDAISTLGFRGEALASIAAVSDLELTTRSAASCEGSFIHIKGGKVTDRKNAGSPVGTTFVIRDLFFNTPARYKFLKKDSTEAGYVSELISRMILGNPNVSFHLISSHATVLHSPGNGELLSAIYSVFGKDTARSVLEVNYEQAGISVKGYVGKPELARSNRNQQIFFLNGRLIKSKLLSSALDEAYKTLLMSGKFAFAVLQLEINPHLVDVNVHPTKMEVRFSDEQNIFRTIYHAVNNTLLKRSLIPEVQTRESQQTYHQPDKQSQLIQQSQQSQLSQQNVQSRQIQNQQSMQSLQQQFNQSDRQTPIQHLQQYNHHQTQINRQPDQQLLKKPYHQTNSFQQTPFKQMGFEFLRINKKLDPDCGNKNNLPEMVDNIDNNREDTVSPENENPVEGKMLVREGSDDISSGGVQEKFKDLPIIGQAFSTYIFLQGQKEMYIVDQHAAHERILFEKLKANLITQDKFTQMLLMPAVIELTHSEYQAVKDNRSFLQQLGFEVDFFGGNSIAVRGIPTTFKYENEKQLFLEVLDILIHSDSTAGKLAIDKEKNILQLREETIHSMACKMAVKANFLLTEPEIRELLRKLDEIDNPFTCPHGRPVAIKMSRYELEKRFKRIV